MNKVRRYTLIAIAAMLTASPALAHHSFAMFDQSKKVRCKAPSRISAGTIPMCSSKLLVKNDARQRRRVEHRE